jgi:hypothetical protein
MRRQPGGASPADTAPIRCGARFHFSTPLPLCYWFQHDGISGHRAMDTRLCRACFHDWKHCRHSSAVRCLAHGMLMQICEWLQAHAADSQRRRQRRQQQQQRRRGQRLQRRRVASRQEGQGCGRQSQSQDGSSQEAQPEATVDGGFSHQPAAVQHALGSLHAVCGMLSKRRGVFQSFSWFELTLFQGAVRQLPCL